MDTFPSNSQRPVRQQIQTSAEEPRRIEPIVTSGVTRRKTTMFRRAKQNIDAQGAGAFVISDILIPSFRDMLLDAVRAGAERLIFPDSMPSRRNRSYGGGPTNYTAMSSRSTVRPDGRRDMSNPGRAQHNFDEIVLESRFAAKQVLDQLEEYLDKYQVVSVADLYQLVGVPAGHVDNKWGWTDLGTAGVSHVRDGYLLNLPRPERLN